VAKEGEKEKRKRSPQFLALRLLNKKIAAAFRPTKMILQHKYTIIPKHIKTIQWKKKSCFGGYHIAELVAKNPHITRLISDHNNYCFEDDYKHIKKITCTSGHILLENCEKSKLTYYKGPYSFNLRTFPFLKKVCLTYVYDLMCFNDNLKKMTVDTIYTFFNLSNSKIEVLKLKGGGGLGKNSLPSTLKVLKVSKSIYEENKDIFENVYYKLIVF
jgi:hypothetical protein